MKSILTVLVTLANVLVTLNAQPLNNTIPDPRDSSQMLYGYFSQERLTQPPFASWFNTEYDQYRPDHKTMKTLKKKIPKNISVILVMGTWCPDSRREVPRFFKILDEIGFDKSKLIDIAVDRTKNTTDVQMQHLNITNVPTIIFYQNDNEIGRIIEKPDKTLEKDMLAIFKKYK